MQSYLYLESTARTAALAQLIELRALPGLSTLRDLRQIDCLTVDTPYSAEAIAPILRGLGVTVTTTLPLDDDTRCLPMPETVDRDIAMLLAAAGIDATVTRTPLLLLRGLDDTQYRTVRDALAAHSPTPIIPRSLPDDAFVGFTRTPADRLALDAARYGLALPEPCLDAIAAHYRSLGRDPWPDELLMLDEAYRAAIVDPACAAPIEFATDDSRLHLAYADMMAKRRVLDPNADAPATLSELSALASRYLCAHRGKACPGNRLSSTRLDLAASGGIVCGGFADRASETCLYFAEKPMPDGKPSTGDHLLLILPTDEADFPSALTRFFATSTVANQIRRSTKVEPGQLIAALGRTLAACGLGLSLSKLPPETTLMEQLTPAQPGVLLACAPSGSRSIPDAIRASGLHFIHLGVLTGRPLLTLEGSPHRLAIPIAMLAPRPTVAAVHHPKPVAPTSEAAPIPALLSALSSTAMRRTMVYDPTIAPQITQNPATLICCGGNSLCAITVPFTTDPYTDVRDAALSLIARLTSIGIARPDITLACSIGGTVADRDAAGAMLAALLALHTVEVELGIPAAPADLHHSESLTVTVAAYAPDPQKPETRPPADSPLWLCAPRSTEPHLNGEDALLRMSLEAIRQGHAVNATGLLPPSAIVTLTNTPLILTAPAEVLNAPIPCGMVIASPEMPRLPDGVAAILLGYTCTNPDSPVVCGDEAVSNAAYLSALCGSLPAPILPPPTEAKPPRISARRHTRPRVLIPYMGDKPTVLARTITAYGGEPLLCSINLSSAQAARQSLSIYAEAMDSAQILLLSGSRTMTTALLSQRRAADAMAALRARDGLICAWSEAFAALLSLGCFSPDGSPIPAAPLQGVTMLTTVLTATTSPWVDDFPYGYRETALFAAPPICPILTPEQRRTLIDTGLITAVAEATPDGTPAVTALTTPDGSLIGLATPPSASLIGCGIGCFM